MSYECPGKNSWPELVGTNGDYAALVIERENTRVDESVDKNRIVVKVPIAG
ncbi:unnamed protein product [Brassica rapa]|uniref:Uncharacterized protein n=2 Tax=Brassica TaxID=3705 RepID=A0A3P5ZHW8_BRACM|nr:unnamed protein product [Brassica napus]CAG7880807.1 unnamed protein product [Brassica rapa]CDY07693.1 BnaA03g18180D [Brassica napus]VDC80186.1 unnamed protein product [Brassica rapa]